jgi:hypothetical protein
MDDRLMIKASATTDRGAKLVIIGLSRANCELLLAGKPIAFQGTDVELHTDPPTHILLVGGETEEAIAEELKKHFPTPRDSQGT